MWNRCRRQGRACPGRLGRVPALSSVVESPTAGFRTIGGEAATRISDRIMHRIGRNWDETAPRGDGERSLAVFIDFENLALGFQNRRDRFEIGKVLERLVEKGKIVAKKAYADWSRFGDYTAPLHEAAIELIEIPRRGQTGKNSADIRLSSTRWTWPTRKDHIDTFVIVSGDSDFSPLVSKLKENGKHVIGLGMQDVDLRPAARQLRRVHLLRGPRPAPPIARRRHRRRACPETKRKVFAPAARVAAGPAAREQGGALRRRWSRTR